MQFVVEKDGSVNKVEVLRGGSGGPGLSASAVSAIKKLKTFTPGKQQGVPVRVQVQYPVKFVLN